MEGWSTGGPPGLTSATPFFRLLDLPREIIRLICLHVYDPLSLSQQDRLSTYMHPLSLSLGLPTRLQLDEEAKSKEC